MQVFIYACIELEDTQKKLGVGGCLWGGKTEARAEWM